MSDIGRRQGRYVRPELRDYEAASALWLARQRDVPLGGDTCVTRSGEVYAITWRGIDVVTYAPDGHVMVRSGGLVSAELVYRIAAFAPPGVWSYRVMGRDGAWRVRLVDDDGRRLGDLRGHTGERVYLRAGVRATGREGQRAPRPRLGNAYPSARPPRGVEWGLPPESISVAYTAGA